ncbi:MAG TPA: ABC transporter permease [Jatrophihabitans sp.]|nr:ABC transporter permease [Jatrophihabitans sp.]
MSERSGGGTALGPRPEKHSGDEVKELVERYNLQRAGARLPLWDYTRQVWARRHFISSFSSANNQVGYSGNFLGQAWQLLTPLLNVGVYFLVFGELLHTKRGVHNFISYLTIGLFVFTFTSTAVTQGSKAISSRLGLTRALHFPRAVLPLSTTLQALQTLIFSMIIMIPIVLITGEPITWRWVLIIPAVALQSLFALGLAFIFARVGAHIPDTSQLLPFLMRVWMYCSGILYAVSTVTRGHADWVKQVFEINPAYVYVHLARHAFLTDNPATMRDWQLAAAWGVVALLIGYVVFWQGEESYGRV